MEGVLMEKYTEELIALATSYERSIQKEYNISNKLTSNNISVVHDFIYSNVDEINKIFNIPSEVKEPPIITFEDVVDVYADNDIIGRIKPTNEGGFGYFRIGCNTTGIRRDTIEEVKASISNTFDVRYKTKLFLNRNK